MICLRIVPVILRMYHIFGTWIALILLLISMTEGVIFTNQIAARITGGPEVAIKIAEENSLVYLGQIGSLADHYLFQHPRIRKRSASESEHHRALQYNKNIQWSEQQRLLKRVKRDIAKLELSSLNRYMWKDPLYQKQWYLHKVSGKSFSDMNVEAVWFEGYSGRNVSVTILDDGIQTDHGDLILNYDPQASTDLNDNDNDPTPRNDGMNKHGTRCAGLVSSQAGNNICGVGVAYNAKIGGIRILDGDINDALEAKAISFNPNHVDIYSASWGPEDGGRTLDGPGPLTIKAMEEGIKKGRNGKGSVYVWASGNGGKDEDSCSCDGYASSIYTISVSSANQYGMKPWYLEECPSTLTTTYSSGTSFQDSVVTTDYYTSRNPKDFCTERHSGTSASAPIVAGIIALALEANPALTWRDLQHLVIRASNPEPLEDPEWKTNGVGRKVSNKFGFGLLDASSLVEQAKWWKRDTLPAQRICQPSAQEPNEIISTQSSFTLSTKSCRNTDNQISKLEHVQAVITIAAQRRGNIMISLTSPRNTTSILLPKRPKDDSNQGFLNWAFTSVHYWDEDPLGRWTLNITYTRDSEQRNGFILSQKTILKSWRLIFYGTHPAGPIEVPSRANDIRGSKAPPASATGNSRFYLFSSNGLFLLSFWMYFWMRE